MMYRRLWLAAVLLAAGCSRQADTSWPECSQSSADIQYANLKLERIQLDSVYTSGDGYSGIYRDDGLYFYDKYFGYLFVFNADGHLKSRALGMGNVPKEIKIKEGLACAASSTGDLCIAGSTLDFQVYDVSKDSQSATLLCKGYPRVYVSEPYKYASFNLVNFTPSDGGFYVNFEADSAIYRCDMGFHALEAFGRAGKEMDSDYLPVRSYEDADKYIKNRQEKGSYAFSL